MKKFITIALVAALATPALAADLKITTSKHTDASSMMGQEIPAQDSTSITWIAKDKMRMEEGDAVTIVRSDLKKMFIVHTTDKTYSALDLPYDMTKHLPPEAAPMMEMMFKDMKVTVTPTTETKKIKDWNATKYTMTMSMGMMTMTSDMWATKDVAVDQSNFANLHGSFLSLLPGGAAMAAEFKKMEGLPVLTERKQVVMGSETRSKEEVTAIEMKDAPEGSFDVPKDYKEKPFDPMNDNPAGKMGGPGRGPGRSGGMHPPGGKPMEPPKVPPTPAPK